jgi:hypothetical protein
MGQAGDTSRLRGSAARGQSEQHSHRRVLRQLRKEQKQDEPGEERLDKTGPQTKECIRHGQDHKTKYIEKDEEKQNSKPERNTQIKRRCARGRRACRRRYIPTIFCP